MQIGAVENRVSELRSAQVGVDEDRIRKVRRGEIRGEKVAAAKLAPRRSVPTSCAPTIVASRKSTPSRTRVDRLRCDRSARRPPLIRLVQRRCRTRISFNSLMAIVCAAAVRQTSVRRSIGRYVLTYIGCAAAVSIPGHSSQIRGYSLAERLSTSGQDLAKLS